MLLLIGAAGAATQSLSFVPWSGAALTVEEDGAALAASVSTPLLPQARATWTLDVEAGVPASLLSSTAAGTYEVEVGVARNNARDIKKAIDHDVFDATLTRGISAGAIVEAVRRLSAWCEVLNDATTTSVSDEALRAAVLAADAKQRTAWITRIDGLIAADPGVARATACAQPLDAAELAAALPPIRGILEDVVAMEQEAALFANDVAATPLNQLARREVSRLLWRAGPTVSYAWTVDQAEAGAPTALDTHGGDLGAAASFYFPEGFAVAAGVGGTGEWAPDRPRAASTAAYVELGGVYTIRTRVRAPVSAAEAAAEASTKQAAKKGNTALGSTDQTGTASDTPLYYVAVEATGRFEYGTEGDVEMAQLAVAVRPTTSGVGVAFGARLDRAAGEVAVLPMVSLAGELPDLVTAR